MDSDPAGKQIYWLSCVLLSNWKTTANKAHKRDVHFRSNYSLIFANFGLF